MIDGILDLLTAILIMGIVVAVAFGFILPLTNDDLMQYSSNYQDKGIVAQLDDYSNPDVLTGMDKRLYTYEEMILLLYVQDDSMEEPKAINFRNMVYGKPYSNNANLRQDKFNLSNLNALPDTLSVAERENMVKDGIFQGILYYGENGMDRETFAYSKEKNKYNVGVFRINDSFFTNFSGEGNLGQLMSDSALSNGYTAQGPYKSVAKGDAGYDDYEYSMKNYNKRRVFHIGYRFALPDGSTSIDSSNTSKYIKAMDSAKYHKNYDEENMFFVEVQGYWPIGSTTFLDTYKEYQDFITEVKEVVDTSIS